MTLGRQRYMLMGIGLGLIVGLILTAVPMGAAYARAPVGEGIYPEYYPDDFDGMGHIDKMAKDGIIVDDSFYPFANSVTYATLIRRYGSKSDFRAGDYVGFKLDAQDRITGMWLFKKGKR